MNRSPRYAPIWLAVTILALPQCVLPAFSATARTAAAIDVSLRPEPGKAERAAVSAQLSLLTRAVMAGNAKILSSLWTDDGSYVDDSGDAFSGRQQIESRFESMFKSGGGFAVEIQPTSERLLARNVMLVEGLVKRVSPASNLDTRYSMVFVKQGDKWLISSATETPVTPVAPPPVPNTLGDLGWMVGEWSAKQGDSSVRITSEWAGHKNFIVSRFDIERAGQPPVVEMQVTGWNPNLQKIVSWHSDTEGGFGCDIWSKKDNNWTISSSEVHGDGRKIRSLHILSVSDPNTYAWSSVHRSVDGVAVADTNPLKVERVSAQK